MPEPRTSAASVPSPVPGAAPGGRRAAAGDPAPAPRSGAPGASGLRREILLRLRLDGPSSPDQLAARLEASRTGVLQQLRALEAAGLVRHEPERHGVGRPRHLYDVTEEAQELFPSNYDGLAAGLLEAIGSLGGDQLVEEVFAARRRQIGDRVRRELDDRAGPSAPLAERVRVLAMIQDEQGYLCSTEPLEDGSIRLREHNCAILDVARGARAACDAELDLFREILGVDVVRETHIAAGDRCCTYRIAGEPMRAPD
ncbi:MAG TPA: helix-turn-helix domain-containing protein [Vitreimonas sp.]|nr:helix-turn-helix domain-containing protein [Vitreimonas sp.]